MTSPTTATVSRATDEQKEAAADWDIWESATHAFDTPGAATGLGKFFFDYADNYEERVVVLEGSALLHPSGGGDAISLKAGDSVSFLQGFACTWEVLESMRKVRPRLPRFFAHAALANSHVSSSLRVRRPR